MGLTERLARYATARPRPFIVAAPGATQARLFLEAELRKRRWHQATSPAAADLLAICGAPDTSLAQAIDTVWDDMPAPRARMPVGPSASLADIAAALDQARAELRDLSMQTRQGEAPEGHDHIGRADEHAEHSTHEDDHGAHEHEQGAAGHGHGEDGHGHGDHEPEHAGHAHGGGHEHHMGGHAHHMMGMIAGVPMADRAPDRDGLKLDVLHVPLGPVLADWPAGLRVMGTLQGDVVQAAEIEVLGGEDGGRFWDDLWLTAAAGERVTRGAAERRRAAAHLDSVARLLGVAGWRSQADRARALRDDVLAGRPGGQLVAAFARFTRRAGRSRSLRWMTRDVGVIGEAMAVSYDLPKRYVGDVAARLAGRLAEIGEALARADDQSVLDGDDRLRVDAEALLAVLPSLLAGAEFSAARLIVASLDPDLDQTVVVMEPAGA